MDQPKIERVLKLIMLMTGDVDYTIDEMTKLLDTSYRSVYRYIDTFKQAGFVVNKKHSAVYHIAKEQANLKDLAELIHFTPEESKIVNEIIDSIDTGSSLYSNLRKKLASVYDCTNVIDAATRGKKNLNVNAIAEAMDKKKQVLFTHYRSMHSNTAQDRIVEPFAFTNNYDQIWCYDPNDAKCPNKLFNTARMQKAIIQDKDWEHEAEHKSSHTDVFRMSGDIKYRVKLRLQPLSRQLLLEEFPYAAKDLTPDGATHWILDTDICDDRGVLRFVIGLMDKIQIIDSPELVKAINKFAKKYILPEK